MAVAPSPHLQGRTCSRRWGRTARGSPAGSSCGRRAWRCSHRLQGRAGQEMSHGRRDGTMPAAAPAARRLLHADMLTDMSTCPASASALTCKLPGAGVGGIHPGQALGAGDARAHQAKGSPRQLFVEHRALQAGAVQALLQHGKGSDGAAAGRGALRQECDLTQKQKGADCPAAHPSTANNGAALPPRRRQLVARSRFGSCRPRRG